MLPVSTITLSKGAEAVHKCQVLAVAVAPYSPIDIWVADTQLACLENTIGQ